MDMRGDVTDAGRRRRTNNEQLKIELLSQWKLDAEFRNLTVRTSKMVQTEVVFDLICSKSNNLLQTNFVLNTCANQDLQS